MVNIWNKKGLTAPKRKLFQIVSLNVKYRICVWDSYSAVLYVDYILWFNFLESYIINILHFYIILNRYDPSNDIIFEINPNIFWILTLIEYIIYSLDKSGK